MSFLCNRQAKPPVCELVPVGSGTDRATCRATCNRARCKPETGCALVDEDDAAPYSPDTYDTFDICQHNSPCAENAFVPCKLNATQITAIACSSAGAFVIVAAILIVAVYRSRKAARR